MEFDPLLADSTRLKIVALLASCDWAEFSFVRESAGLSKSALSKQIAKLEANEYVQVHKGYVGKFPRTSLKLTDTGRTAIEDHLAALQRIVDQSRGGTSSP
ncbi:transcriptional regulator [Nocardiopsis sp. MG754419]|uniref:winged helix-turn-helix domain-containing protein n=1 Tax=Nocardiopsis sp. MG754419 TaxID=2259865 RepID=UPI001BA89923|nr:transcriptional regulator [Nocardiopsis sp. MG754419]MBR8744768.1 transcriptional regulator [Nocardiopsis sp. MG754419]